MAFFFETTVSQRFFFLSLSLHWANRTIMTPFKAWTIAQPMDESRWRKTKPFQKLFFKKNKKRLRKLQMWTSMQWNTFCILCSEQKEREKIYWPKCVIHFLLQHCVRNTIYFLLHFQIQVTVRQFLLGWQNISSHNFNLLLIHLIN